jgi:DNA polymerase elongation subunit (family B)
MKGYNYKTNTIMADFIKPVYEERKHSKGVMKMAIKLLLNSLYGKFAQDLSGNIFVYTSIDEHHEVLAIDIEHLYKPLASAITAYARRNWIDVMSLLGDDFVYGDTDSVYFLNVEKNMKILRDAGKIHENELGKWALDDGYGSIIPKAKFISKKNYMLELEDGSQVIKCVGLSHRFHDQLNFDNFVINSIPFKVEKMVNVYGGKAMRETEFKIRERSNF